MNRLLLIILMMSSVLLANDKMKIYFEAGSASDNFSVVISNGAKLAAKELGVDLEVMYSDWDPAKMIENFNHAASQKPQGIVVMGHPGDKFYEPFIQKAIKNGISVTSIDTELPRNFHDFSADGFGYAGGDNYKSGEALAHEAIKKFALKNGDKVMVWGLLSKPTRGLRARAMIDVFKHKGLKVQYIEISSQIDKDPKTGLETFANYIKRHPETKLIALDHGALTAAMPEFFKTLNLNAQTLNVAGFSLAPTTIEGIKNDHIDLVVDSQPFFQGYISIVQIVMSKRYGFSGLKIDTGGGFITNQNISFIEQLVKDGIR